MKIEILQRLNLRSLGKKPKYLLLCIFIAGVILFIHQLFWFNLLNEEVVRKLINGSAEITNRNVNTNIRNNPPYSKFQRNTNLSMTFIRGVRIEDRSKYLPNTRGKFVCFVSKEEIDYNKVNDDYCDCPKDGSDEPSTNACNNGIFYCEISAPGYPIKIASYKINDGYCDCCDGSDEWKTHSFLKRVAVKLKFIDASNNGCLYKC